MSSQIIRFRNYEQPEYAEKALAIRHEVFVTGQHVDPSLEYEHEDEAHHYLLLLDDKPVSTARWRKTENGIKLERFATLADHRNQGYGAELLKEVLQDVIPSGKIIYLNAQLSAVRFYERYGFVKEGEIFSEADIDHYLMIYRP